MQSQVLSCGIEHPRLAIIQAVFQIRIVQLFLQHYENNCQQLSRRRIDCFSRTFLTLLSLVKVHQWRIRSINHRQNCSDCHRPQSLSAFSFACITTCSAAAIPLAITLIFTHELYRSDSKRYTGKCYS